MSLFNKPKVWDVSNVENMSYMFRGAKKFNQDLSSWNVSNVTDMLGMFANTEKFNQDLNKWNVSKVKDMGSMFKEAKKFNQDLSSWKVENVSSCYEFSGQKYNNKPKFTNCKDKKLK